MTGSPISDYGYPTPYNIATPRIRTSVGGLGVAVIVLLALDAALAALAAGFLVWRRSLLTDFLNDPGSVAPAGLDSSDAGARNTMGCFSLVTLATIIVFICWFWAARTNAEAYSPNRGTLGVGWSIGGWFIPVAALVLPCIVARDINRGTMRGHQRRPVGGGLLTGWWWAAFLAFWLAGLVVSGANGRLQNDAPADRATDLQSAATDGIVALAIGVAAALLAIAYVATITREQKARNLAGAWYGGPGMPAQAPYGMAYGYGVPGYPMPGQVPGPGGYAMPGYPMPSQPPAAPTQEAWAVPEPVPPVQDRIPVADTQTADVQDIEPPKEPGDWLTPPG
ncbi:DUF4328 domain-containing protein [Catenulispora rubra]|uniref:DUF4328 domain-containing protein n=1 Tax=Catenulispora rubra TaxID=280293 RepID=UPI001892068F|nr:DUF4328 domain-containing protein [Catenulispora rubra]